MIVVEERVQGDDPLTTGQVDEIQELTCDASTALRFEVRTRIP